MLFASAMIGGRVATLTFLGSSSPNNSNTSSYTFSGFTIPAGGGYFIVCINGDSSVIGRTLNSVSVGGAGATLHANQAGSLSALSESIAAIAGINLPAGATGNIVLNFNNNMNAACIECYVMQRAQSNTPFAAAGVTNPPGTGVTGVSTTINIPSRGVLVVTASANPNGHALVMTGAVEDAQQVILAGAYVMHSGSGQKLAAQTARPIGSSSPTAPAATSYALAAVSWQ